MPLLLRSPLAVLAFFAVASAATGAHAAEFGDASVRSFSGQPLSADIELTDLTAQELADLQVRLARPDVFRGANVKMSPALAGASVSIVRRNDRRVLHVTTSAPVQGDVLHLYFQLVSGGKERVRSVSLWLSPDPTPAPMPAPATPAIPDALAAAPVPAVERTAKPVVRRAGGERPGALVATVSPGREATAKEQELLGAIGRAIGAHGGKVAEREPVKAVSGKQENHSAESRDVRKEALKYASTADDFKRGAKPATQPAKPAVAERKVSPAQEPVPAQAAEPAPENKAPQRSFLSSKAELAEAARATRASVEGGTAPAVPQKTAKAPEAAAPVRPAAAQPDMAMLNKLSELEGKLKTLQAQLGIANEAGAARVTAPVAGTPVEGKPMDGKPVLAPEAPKPANPVPATRTPDVATVAAAAAAQPAPAAKADVVQPPPAGTGTEHAAAGATMPVPPVEEAKAQPEVKKPEEKKEAAPPPPEPKKPIKISRPKLLMFLFAGFLVLVAMFGVAVHFIRKKKMRRSPIVRQTWSRDEDDAPVRIEPAIAPAAPPESKVA
ncbi:type IV pilus assembly protein FimV [Pseudoduganella lutea]|uniref:FimV N-terminal domain-containing protein n=1 Tax=Pseudoduganella lutea TaxID=321985 RepID=A0A4P6KU63_9BURK|nr:hypothetical protein [Pseudoduganella lutea]QBE62639.1 hypothetical protein EWM63_06360 [Pseudoduganella lutea]